MGSSEAEPRSCSNDVNVTNVTNVTNVNQSGCDRGNVSRNVESPVQPTCYEFDSRAASQTGFGDAAADGGK